MKFLWSDYLRKRMRREWRIWLEGALLLAATPFLLFPERIPVATLLALLALAGLELFSLWPRSRPFPRTTPIDVLLLLWGLILIVSILVTADPDLTLPKATGVILGLFALRLLTRAVPRAAYWFGALALWGGLGLGFVGLGVLGAQWLNKVPLLAPIIARLPTGVVSIAGAAEEGVHTNQIAGTLIFYFPLLISGLIGWRWRQAPRWLTAVWLLLTVMGTAVLLLTQSRSGWLGGLAGLFILFLLWALILPRHSLKGRLLWAIVGLMLVAGLAGAVAIGPERLQSLWQDPAQETAVGSLGTLSFRQEVWRWTAVAIGDFAFTGIGLGSFQRVIRRLYPLNVRPDYGVVHAHNLYLHTAVDVGIPGFVVYLGLVGLTAVLGWQAAKRDERLRPYVLGLLAGLAAFHVYGIGDTLALGSKTGLVFWGMLGLLVAARQLTVSSVKFSRSEGFSRNNGNETAG